MPLSPWPAVPSKLIKPELLTVMPFNPKMPVPIVSSNAYAAQIVDGSGPDHNAARRRLDARRRHRSSGLNVDGDSGFISRPVAGRGRGVLIDGRTRAGDGGVADGRVSDVAGVHAALARSTAMNDTVNVSAAATRRRIFLAATGFIPQPLPRGSFRRSFQRDAPARAGVTRHCADAGLAHYMFRERSAGRLGRLRQLLGQKRKTAIHCAGDAKLRQSIGCHPFGG